MAREYDQIRYEVADNVLTITLDRPDKMNAWTRHMQTELHDALARANADDEVRAIVFTGAGRAFCAGFDLSYGAKTFDYADRGAVAPTLPDGSMDLSSETVRDGAGRMSLDLFRSLKPVIAAINGPAVGMGLTITLAMDFRLLADSAKLGFVFTRRGIVPEGCSTYFLPRLVGIGKALDWTMTGRFVLPDEALESRLVNSVHPAGEVLAAAQALGREIAQNTAPVPVALTRQMLWQGLGWNHPMDAHKIESRSVYTLGPRPDALEGVTSFLEKRSPQFRAKVSEDMPPFYPWADEPPYA